MKKTQFIEEKIFFILMNITFLFFLNIYLYFLNIYIVNLIILDLIWLIIFLIFFSLEYIKINKRYKYIKKLTDNLTEKYLIAEILPKPQTLEEKAYYYALKKACKSLNDKLTETENKYQNYEEYIESFVHEIKSPISVISLIGDNENNQIIKEETRKIDDLCEQILFFSRTKNPENDYFIKKINLEDVIHKTLIDYKNIILKNKIKIEVKDTQKIVYTDEKWLKFIIKQILQNSLKYLNKEAKEIEIKTKEEPHNITLIIKDNGVGIHDYDLPKIYNYGFTGSDRKKTHSTGIGLYLAKKLSEKLNLNLKTTSEYNKYTQTEITIPKESTYIIKEGDLC